MSTVPPLKVRRMGKKFRICYEETFNLARYNSGEPVDGGGFDDQTEALIAMSKAIEGQQTSDPEEENVGP